MGCILFEEVPCDQKEFGLEQLFIEVEGQHDMNQLSDELSVLFLLICAVQLDELDDAFNKSLSDAYCHLCFH